MNIFTAYISGAADSLPDYPFPISSFSVNKRSGVNSYYQVAAPLTLALLQAIEARPNGDIYIEKDGVAYENFNIENYSDYKGSKTASLTISGYRQETNASPAAVAIANDIVISKGTDYLGRLNLRLVPFSSAARPADTVTYDSINYTVYQINTQVNPEQFNQMITLEVIV